MYCNKTMNNILPFLTGGEGKGEEKREGKERNFKFQNSQVLSLETNAYCQMRLKHSTFLSSSS